MTEDQRQGYTMSEITRVRPADFSEAESALVDELFAFQPWGDDQIEQGRPVREALAEAYKQVLKNVPSSPTRTRALNMIVDARMLANSAITFKGLV